MKKKLSTGKIVSLVVMLALVVAGATWRIGGQTALAAQAGQQSVPTDPLSIGGVVLNAGQTPEAGVWVIAETDSLPTHFRRIVVTDDQGRFLVPDLPKGAYEVWVRGYGLRDSKPVKAARGERVTLQVTKARTPQEAARIYPTNYWFSLLEAPPKAELPAIFASQEEWLNAAKISCTGCHQMGAKLTRLWTRPDDWEVVWTRTIQVT